MFAPTFSPSGPHTHLAQTTKFDAIMNNKSNKICWKHEFHKTRIRRGLYDKITKQIEYEPCPECIVEKEQKEKEEILKLEAERNRIAKETHELYRKKLNIVFENKTKEIYLAEEAARIVKDDEKAELLLKAENLRIYNEETGLRRRRQEQEAEDERRRQQEQEQEADDERRRQQDQEQEAEVERRRQEETDGIPQGPTASYLITRWVIWEGIKITVAMIGVVVSAPVTGTGAAAVGGVALLKVASLKVGLMPVFGIP